MSRDYFEWKCSVCDEFPQRLTRIVKVGSIMYLCDRCNAVHEKG